MSVQTEASAYEVAKDYLHVKQQYRHAIDGAKKDHSSAILPHLLVNGVGQLIHQKLEEAPREDYSKCQEMLTYSIQY